MEWDCNRVVNVRQDVAYLCGRRDRARVKEGRWRLFRMEARARERVGLG